MARDYEMEAAAAAVAALCPEPVDRALTVGAPGSQENTLSGAFKSLFGKSRRESGIATRNVLALTPTSVRLYACKGRGARPLAEREVGAWPHDRVRIEAVTGEQWTAFNVNENGSSTNRFYVLTLVPTDGGAPVVLQCPRSDSARATIQAIEDATGSPPSKITARRRKKADREDS